MNVIVYHGNGTSRAMLRELEFWYAEPFISKEDARKLRAAGRVKFHILITTYEVALKVKTAILFAQDDLRCFHLMYLVSLYGQSSLAYDC